MLKDILYPSVDGGYLAIFVYTLNVWVCNVSL